MNNILFDYSNLIKRDTKIYSIGGVGIPGGLSINFAKVVFPVAIVVIFLGYLLSLLLGLNMFNFMDGLTGIREWHWKYLITCVIIGVLTGLGLWNINVGGYRLYQYLLAYFRPKKVYTNNSDVRNREFKFHNITIKTIIRQEL